MKKRIIAIGCGGAGMFSCIVATQLKPSKFEATVFSEEKDIYCRCTSPYILTNKASIKEAIQPDSMIEDFGVSLKHETVVKINKKHKTVTTDKNKTYEYDYLVLSTGSSPCVPNIEGVDHPEVYTVRESDDIRNISKSIKTAKRAVVIGGGIIGIEMAGALREKNLDVSLVEFTNTLMPNISGQEYASRVQDYITKKGIKVHLNSCAKIINSKGKRIKSLAILSHGIMSDIKADIVILATGVKANAKLAEDIGIKTNQFGIIVDDKMRTSERAIYACGDCAVSKSMITGEYIPAKLASVAIQQAKIVGYQIAGYPIEYHRTNGAFAFQTLGLEYAQAGLNEEQARKKFRWVVTGKAETTNVYRDMKNKEDLEVKIIFAGPMLKIVGIQAIGKGVTGHVETVSLAMSMNTTIMKLLRFNYIAHPSLTPWPFMNPIIMAAEDAIGKVKKKFLG